MSSSSSSSFSPFNFSREHTFFFVFFSFLLFFWVKKRDKPSHHTTLNGSFAPKQEGKKKKKKVTKWKLILSAHQMCVCVCVVMRERKKKCCSGDLSKRLTKLRRRRRRNHDESAFGVGRVHSLGSFLNYWRFASHRDRDSRLVVVVVLLRSFWTSASLEEKHERAMNKMRGGRQTQTRRKFEAWRRKSKEKGGGRWGGRQLWWCGH